MGMFNFTPYMNVWKIRLTLISTNQPGNTIPTPAVCAPTATITPGTNGTAPSSVPTTPGEPIDEVTIVSATFVRTRGETAYTVSVVDSVTTGPFPVLTLTGTAMNK